VATNTPENTGSSFSNITKIPELRKRLLFAAAMVAVYRLGVYVTTPNVDRSVMQRIVSGEGGFLNLFNLFSGGALENLSIFALGIMPYVSASIIMQLLTVVIPRLEQLQKEGELGRRKINQYTRYGTIVLAVVQGVSIAAYLQSLNDLDYGRVVSEPGLAFTALTVLTLTTGTAFIMWLGEQITERGIGNGISLIIFAGIVARLPGAVYDTYRFATQELLEPITIVFIAGIIVLTIGTIIFFERGQRRIPIQYAKRMVGRKVYGGQSTHLPLKINMSGVIPPIFASSLLLFPQTIAQLFSNETLKSLQNLLQPGTWLYDLFFVSLIIFFCFFYTSVQFNPADVADNIKKNGGFIPGIRPGKQTADYIDRVLTRITVVGAVYISLVCVLPQLLQQQFKLPFYFGGTALLIVVGVALDTTQQIESHLITRHYDGFAGPKGKRLRGRKGE
jgi:preprotein translocase subunit SecY